MHSTKPGSSRRTFLSSAIAASAYVWIPKPVKGYTAAEMRAMTIDADQAGRLEVGARHAGALRRSRQDGEERRDDAGGAEEVRAAEPPAREDAQVRGDREVPARHRIDRHLLREAERGGGDGRARRRQDPDDDVEPVEEQDPPGDGAPQGAPQFHPGGGRGAERPGSLGGGEGGRRDGRRRHRRRGRDAERHSRRERASSRWRSSSTSCPTSSCAGCCRTTAACSTPRGLPAARSAR